MSCLGLHVNRLHYRPIPVQSYTICQTMSNWNYCLVIVFCCSLEFDTLSVHFLIFPLLRFFVLVVFISIFYNRIAYSAHFIWFASSHKTTFKQHYYVEKSTAAAGAATHHNRGNFFWTNLFSVFYSNETEE